MTLNIQSSIVAMPAAFWLFAPDDRPLLAAICSLSEWRFRGDLNDWFWPKTAIRQVIHAPQ